MNIMNIVITPSTKSDKKFTAKIDDKNITKMKKEKKLIYQGISTTTPKTLYILHSTLLICYGINQH